ncbi:MAG: hypothetical protein V4526_00615 [Patescibacteria group bacterium]
MFLFPKVALAAADMKAIDALLAKLSQYIIAPLVTLLFGAAVLVFLWGMLQLIMHADDPEGRTTGQKHILWGVIGMAIMASVYGIIRFVANTIGTNVNF